MDSSKSKIDTFILGWGAALILFFSPTLENYHAVFERADYMSFAINSVVISVVATALAILIAVPAAYAMAFFPTKRTKGTLLWMLSTKMMPPVGVLVPMYLLYRDFGLLDTRTGLIIVRLTVNPRGCHLFGSDGLAVEHTTRHHLIDSPSAGRRSA